MIVRRTILNAKSSQASDGRMTPPGEGRRAMGTRIPFKAESGMTVIGQDDMTPTPNAMAGAMPTALRGCTGQRGCNVRAPGSTVSATS